MFMNPVFITLGLTGLSFVIIGWITLRFPPKGINTLYGYRTKASMKNQERWDLAQKHSSRLIAMHGAIQMLMAILSVGLWMFVDISEEIGATAALLVILASVLHLFQSTERAIKRNFGDE